MTSESRPTLGDAGTDEPLRDVWLLRYPLRLGLRSSEHYESVFREFALLAAAEPGPSVPVRMLAWGGGTPATAPTRNSGTRR